MQEMTRQRYQRWKEGLQKNAGDLRLFQELEQIEGDEKELEERFSTELSFGTAGLRGKLGVGSSRMNVITVGKATQGIADYLAAHGEAYKQRGVVIAHDPRHFSREFSLLAARILAANGIHVFLFENLRPTPELAFSILRLHTAAGINITASHNPKEYNGYKVYWENGAQVRSDIADGMLERIRQVDAFQDVRRMDLEEAKEKGLITVLSGEMDREYLDLVKSLAVYSDEKLDRSVSLVYTPLNGAGSIPVQTLLKERGFTRVAIVPSQKDPDPDFTTVGYPNPEDPKAFAQAEKLGREKQAQVLIATDPDADRLAIEVRKPDGSYLPLNGNQTGVLLIHYLLDGWKNTGKLPENGAMVKSIVTGEMGSAICQAYGVKMYVALTGFKNICGKIPQMEADGYRYLFGYEESVGYAMTSQVRDKDGISAALCICEMAAFYQKQGKTLLDVLEELYETYGYYREAQVSLVLEGQEGAGRIARMMEVMRKEKPAAFGGLAVTEIIDYRDGYRDIDPSNVLRFTLEGGSWFAVRPSGTEPKLKLYLYTREETKDQADERIAAIRDDVLGKLQAVE